MGAGHRFSSSVRIRTLSCIPEWHKLSPGYMTWTLEDKKKLQIWELSHLTILLETGLRFLMTQNKDQNT